MGNEQKIVLLTGYVADIVFPEPENEQPSVDDREQADSSFVRRMLHVESVVEAPMPFVEDDGEDIEIVHQPKKKKKI